jgi:hypothetical protein
MLLMALFCLHVGWHTAVLENMPKSMLGNRLSQTSVRMAALTAHVTALMIHGTT